MIELLVVIGVMSMLTSMLVVYNRDSERQLVLFKEQAVLTSAILRARGWSIQTLRADASSPSCGYGVHFSLPDTYTIFRIPKTGICDPDDNQMNPNGVAVVREEVVLPSGIILRTNLTDVFFAPPDPRTSLIVAGSVTDANQIVSLCDSATTESCVQVTVTVTGQVF